MPEVKQCPVCGHDPVICPTWDPAEPEPEATECCGAAFTTVSAWNRYAAAMELAEAKTWEEETYAVLCWLDELPDRKCAFNDSVDLNIYAERAGIDALAKVYEVFK